jgi:hypothetical protein
MNAQKQSRINLLLQRWPKGTVATTRWLQQLCIGRNLAAAYRRSGWVTSIGSGAVIRFGDEVGWMGAVHALQQQLGLSVHPGAKSALALRGAAHSLPMGKERVVLFASQSERLPAWFRKRSWSADLQIVKTNLFADAPHTGMHTMPSGDFTMEVSSRERAMFELLHALAGNDAADEPLHLMDGLATARPDVVQELLLQCRSIKAKRLFMVLAQSADHAWLKKLDVSKVDFGAGKRRFAPNGPLHPRYQITIPRSWRRPQEQS